MHRSVEKQHSRRGKNICKCPEGDRVCATEHCGVGRDGWSDRGGKDG